VRVLLRPRSWLRVELSSVSTPMLRRLHNAPAQTSWCLDVLTAGSLCAGRMWTAST